MTEWELTLSVAFIVCFSLGLANWAGLFSILSPVIALLLLVRLYEKHGLL